MAGFERVLALTVSDFERWLDTAFKWWFRAVVFYLTFSTGYLIGYLIFRRLLG